MTSPLVEDGFNIRNSGRRDLWPGVPHAVYGPPPAAGLVAVASETPEPPAAVDAAAAGGLVEDGENFQRRGVVYEPPAPAPPAVS